MQALQKQQVTQSAQNTVLMTVKNTDFDIYSKRQTPQFLTKQVNLSNVCDHSFLSLH